MGGKASGEAGGIEEAYSRNKQAKHNHENDGRKTKGPWAPAGDWPAAVVLM
jgi:hypothetical protein